MIGELIIEFKQNVKWINIQIEEYQNLSLVGVYFREVLCSTVARFNFALNAMQIAKIKLFLDALSAFLVEGTRYRRRRLFNLIKCQKRPPNIYGRANTPMNTYEYVVTYSSHVHTTAWTEKKYFGQ